MASYDPNLRRDTALARKLIAHIHAHGPITVDAYMDACLNDHEFGYYRRRTAIGRAGDFITAPEISQVFGELIGLWCAVVWQQMGSPARVNLIELGAGRGTLMADALRATRMLPEFRSAVAVHILDQNPVLIAMQRTAMDASGVKALWHETLDALPSDQPSIWIGNEFLDTIPVRQFVRRDGRWSVRAIGLDDAGRLAFVTPPGDWVVGTDDAMRDRLDDKISNDGVVIENQLMACVTDALQRCAGRAPLAALFVDYGHTGAGKIDTLQAVRAHQTEHVLTSPGEADLSCQVDFEDFAFKASLVIDSAGRKRAPSLNVDGPVTQSEFLGQLGIMERASRLMAMNPANANALETGVARLMAPQGMGTRFKAIGLRSPELPSLPGFWQG